VRGSAGTRGAQVAAIGEGLAVGCLVLGAGAVDPDVDVTLAFGRAWRSWPWRSRFPAVRATVTGDVVRRILRRPIGRRDRVAYWSRDPGWTPRLRVDRSARELGAHLAETTGVPLQGWLVLAATFLDARAASAEYA
jgi:hypothetical protein